MGEVTVTCNNSGVWDPDLECKFICVSVSCLHTHTYAIGVAAPTGGNVAVVAGGVVGGIVVALLVILIVIVLLGCLRRKRKGQLTKLSSTKTD